MMTGTSPPPLRFGRCRRLHGNRAFKAVYDAKCRKSSGPLAVLVRAGNGLPFSRLGLSVGKRVHRRAHERAAVKRRLREAFRLSQTQHPLLNSQGDDVVVIVYPHDGPLCMQAYQVHLLKAWQAAHRVAAKRAERMSKEPEA